MIARCEATCLPSDDVILGTTSCGSMLLSAPVEILAMLPAGSVSQLLMADRGCSAAAEASRPSLLKWRGGRPEWSWRMAGAVESAIFRGLVGEESTWTRSSARGMRVSPDWEDFAGWSCPASSSGVRPSWVAFRIDALQLPPSGAALALLSSESAARRGGRKLVLSTFARCREPCLSLLVETPFAAVTVQHLVQADGPCNVVVHFDWTDGLAAVFVDGEPAADVEISPFQHIRTAATFQKSSEFCPAFSELLLGEVCPYGLKAGSEFAVARTRLFHRFRPHFAWMRSTSKWITSSWLFPLAAVCTTASMLAVAEIAQ